MRLDTIEEKVPPALRPLSKINEYAIGAGLLCYATGFVITNLYLGSLGIVSFEVLRVRYIVTGLLFLVYSLIVALLVHGVLPILRSYNTDSSTKPRDVVGLIFRVFTYSVVRLFIIAFIIGAIGALAGSPSSPPVGVVPNSPAPTWSTWFNNLPSVIEISSRLIIVLVLIAPLVLGLIALAVVLINPKDKEGKRHSRLTHLRRIGSRLFRLDTLKAAVLFVILFYVLNLALNLASSLIFFIGTGTVATTGSSAKPSTTSHMEIPENSFVLTAFLFYVVAAIYLLMGAVLGSPTGDGSSDKDEGSEDIIMRNAHWIYLLVLVAGVVIPVYASGVYPNVPQQLGGGKLLRIAAINLSSDNLTVSGMTSQAGAELYLVDRTSDNTLLLVVEPSKRSQELVELRNSDVHGITYKTWP